MCTGKGVGYSRNVDKYTDILFMLTNRVFDYEEYLTLKCTQSQVKFTKQKLKSKAQPKSYDLALGAFA